MVQSSSNLSAETKQALLAAVVASSEDAIISKTLQGIITSWNPAAQKLFGYSEDEAVGKHISFLIPEDRLKDEDYIISEIVKGNKVEHFETVRRTKFGRLIPLSLTVSPILDHEGQIIGASKIARDISERLEIEQERERLYRKSRLLSQRKDQLIAMATHELKTPLTSLNGFLQVLQQKLEPGPNADIVNRCLKQVGRLTALIEDLLDISRMQSGMAKLQFNLFDITELIKEALSDHRHLASHQLVFNAKGSVHVHGDMLRLEQVFANLITNAIKYSPNGGIVEVDVTAGLNEVSISVRDQGIGVDSEHIEELFTQFYRAVDPEYRIPGLGLGLFISKEIVERHGGTISVESQKGVGSTFTVSLPLQQE